jgi:hypothetical protein
MPRRALVAVAASFAAVLASLTGASPSVAAGGPTIDSVGGSPRVQEGDPDTQSFATFTWSGSDGDGSTPVYDVQLSEDGRKGPYTWVQDGHRTSATETDAEFEGESLCFRVRAVDPAGDESAWRVRCFRLDLYAPDVPRRHSLAVVRGIGPTEVRFHYRGYDDSGIASYDVQERVAPKGRLLGPWKAPRALQGLTVRHIEVTVRHGQERCFRVRAYDLVGRFSGWGRQWCAVSPLDDRAFSTRGGLRGHDARALGGTVTVLYQGHDELVARGLVGRSLWIRADSEVHSCPRVWWGSERVAVHACELHGSGRFAWYVVPLLRHHGVYRGRIRILPQQPDTRIAVDAVAVVR